MQQFLFSLSLSLLILSYTKGQESQKLEHKIDQLLIQYHTQKQFNGSVLVAKQGKILFEGAYGYANMETQVPNTIFTKYLIGSTTKSFTAIAILQLWEKGLVELHRPIRAYIPELNEEIGALTLHQLMKNSSGLPVHLNRITHLEHRDISSEELIQLYNSTKLSFKPGSQFEYSNLNYQLCAIVLESVTGIAYKGYMEQHIFQPLKMKDSGIERTKVMAKDKALGYEIKNSHFQKAPKNFMAFAKGGGDIYATAPDLLKWDQALYEDQLLGNAAKQLLFDGHPEITGGYGYGFKIKHYTRSSGTAKGKLVRHGGSMYGYICNVHRYLDDQVTIIVLGNIRPYPTMEITLAIESILLDAAFL